jgi:hypothetical protein
MSNEMGRIWKEVSKPNLRSYPDNLPGQTEENHKKPQSG